MYGVPIFYFQANFEIHFQPNVDATRDDFYDFDMLVNSTNPEAPYNIEDNHKVARIHVLIDYQLEVSGYVVRLFIAVLIQQLCVHALLLTNLGIIYGSSIFKSVPEAKYRLTKYLIALYRLLY